MQIACFFVVYSCLAYIFFLPLYSFKVMSLRGSELKAVLHSFLLFFYEELTDALIKNGQLVYRQKGTINLGYSLKVHKTAVPY